MGVKVDTGAILGKAKQFMNTDAGKQRIKEALQNIPTAEEAAAKFIDVLQQEINGSGLTPGAVGAVSSAWVATGASEIGDFKYEISVYFAGDPSRPSLQPDRYGGVSDIVALFNNGWSAGNAVYGVWHGHETWSRTTCPGAHFLEAAQSSFMGKYARQYHVQSVVINEI